MKIETFADIQENRIREQMPRVLNILLLDRTKSTKNKSQNIIWANDNYQACGDGFFKQDQITPEKITGQYGDLIMPRALKTKHIQKERTKLKAEVFTPTWVVKKQNDELEKDYLNSPLEVYLSKKWLEITCGEAPYIATRYEMETGELIPLSERVGFLDRKLARLNQEIHQHSQWQKLAERAYQACYGFEWNGDSLLLARENLLYTYYDYYLSKWKKEPEIKLFEKIAEIISYNIFQMDGLNYTIPFSQYLKKEEQLSLFQEFEAQDEIEQSAVGILAKIMNWQTKQMELFAQGK